MINRCTPTSKRTLLEGLVIWLHVSNGVEHCRLKSWPLPTRSLRDAPGPDAYHRAARERRFRMPQQFHIEHAVAYDGLALDGGQKNHRGSHTIAFRRVTTSLRLTLAQNVNKCRTNYRLSRLKVR
jgi:hypothetical protein